MAEIDSNVIVSGSSNRPFNHSGSEPSRASRRGRPQSTRVCSQTSNVNDWEGIPLIIKPNGIVQTSMFSTVDDELFSAPNKSKKSKLWDQLQKTPAPPSSLPSSGPRWTKANTEKIHSKLLLCHAQVYIFAEKFGIKPLKQLALRKLRRALTSLDLSTRGSSCDGVQTVDAVVNLLMYVYENTVELIGSEQAKEDDKKREGKEEVKKEDKGGAELRELVVLYAACVVEALVSDKKFLALLMDEGEFARDLVKRLMDRLE